MRIWAKANSPEWPEIESVLILGLTDGVLLIRYFSFSTRDVEGDHWHPTLDDAKLEAEQTYGVEPTAWQVMPDGKDELYELSMMPITANSYDKENADWVVSKFTDYSPKSVRAPLLTVHHGKTLRTLNEAEIALIRHMLRGTAQKLEVGVSLSTCLVEELNDGGMGSLRFDSQNQERVLGQDICREEFPDSDGVPIFVALSLDNYDELFELDIWKVDFSPLKRFPQVRSESD